MPRALILGGTGPIGRATAGRQSGEPVDTFDDAFFEPFLDYAAEDRYHSRSPGAATRAHLRRPSEG
jgi:hypothetical protein